MKVSYYFTHDYNAQNDPKIIKLRMKLGWKGYGLFWAIIELLAQESESRLLKDYDSISFQLREESDIIKSIVEDYDLFIHDDNTFYSKRLNEHKDKRKAISEQRALAGRKGGLSKPEAIVKQLLNNSQAKSSKGNERKENKANIMHDEDFIKNIISDLNKQFGINISFDSIQAIESIDKALNNGMSKEKIIKEYEKVDKQYKNYDKSIRSKKLHPNSVLSDFRLQSK